MALRKLFLSAALVIASGSMLIAADEPVTPTTQPTDAKPRAARLVQPWSLLKTLTPEQTTQIEKIHTDANAEIKKITTKETADITALLTPDQVTELKTAEAKRKEETSKRNKAAATQP